MAIIKLSATDLLQACDRFIGEYEYNIRTMNEQAVGVSEYMALGSKNDIEMIKKIERMCKAVRDTSYPYLMITDVEFQLIGSYL